MPPLLMAGVRLFIAGSILYAWSVGSGVGRSTFRQWRNAVIASVPLFVIGNGGVTWAEQSVPSGLAALIIATLPAWLLLLDWMRGGRSGPRMIEVLGIGLGLAGVAVLAASNGSEAVSTVGIVVLLISAIAWAWGSLFNRYADMPSSPVRTAGMQMLAGGSIMIGVGLSIGEAGKVNTTAISGESIAAFVYLVAVAVVAVPAYTWLLSATSPALVGTYAFVNPVVAVFLGWAVLNEALSGSTGVAVALVVAGVALLTWPRRSRNGEK
jgi:drug/metabolite transporter (DMT)-like permease